MPEIEFRYETKRKVMVDFKFDANLMLYIGKSSYRVNKKVNWKFVLVGGTAHANPT